MTSALLDALAVQLRSGKHPPSEPRVAVYPRHFITSHYVKRLRRGCMPAEVRLGSRPKKTRRFLTRKKTVEGRRQGERKREKQRVWSLRQISIFEKNSPCLE